jgi:hypothetical protein
MLISTHFSLASLFRPLLRSNRVTHLGDYYSVLDLRIRGLSASPPCLTYESSAEITLAVRSP